MLVLGSVKRHALAAISASKGSKLDTELKLHQNYVHHFGVKMKPDLKVSGEGPKLCAHLSGFALELEYVKSRGLAYLQCAENNFAMFNRDTNELTIFGEDIELTASSFHGNEAAEVLRDAQTLGATFTIEDGRCHCCIEDVQCDGETYVEAALRTLITHRSKKPKGN